MIYVSQMVCAETITARKRCLLRWTGTGPLVAAVTASKSSAANGRSSLALVDPNPIHRRASCSRFLATFTLNGEGLTIAPLAATEMACFAALMDQERLFLEVLTQIARCTFGEDGKLVLLSRDARVIVARRAPS